MLSTQAPFDTKQFSTGHATGGSRPDNLKGISVSQLLGPNTKVGREAFLESIFKIFYQLNMYKNIT